MKLYKKYNNFYLFFITIIGSLYIVNCSTSLFGGNQTCKGYKYDAEKQSFVDTFNQPVNCSLADNFRIFEYLPDKGCSFWREHFKVDETMRFVEMVIRSGPQGTSIAKKYCVLQRYIEHDKTGQVMLINTTDGGAYCFKAHSEVDDNYIVHTCDDVKRQSSKEKNTTTETLAQKQLREKKDRIKELEKKEEEKTITDKEEDELRKLYKEVANA